MNKSETRYEKETVCTLTEGPCQEQRNKVGESRTWGQQTSPLTLTSWCTSAFMRFSSLLSDNAFFPALKDSQPERGLRCFCHRMLGLFTNQLAACNSAVYVTAFVAWGLLKIQSYLSVWYVLSEVSKWIPYTSIKESHFKTGDKSRVTTAEKAVLGWFTNAVTIRELSRRTPQDGSASAVFISQKPADRIHSRR